MAVRIFVCRATAAGAAGDDGDPRGVVMLREDVYKRQVFGLSLREEDVDGPESGMYSESGDPVDAQEF